MKKLAAITLLLTLCLSTAFSADYKFGYVNSERIISEYSEVEVAKKKLDTYTAELEKEATEKQKKILEIQQQLQAQALMMSEQKKQELQQQGQELANEYQAFLQKNFGQQGAIAVKNNELMAPIMKSMKEAIDKVSKDGGYSFVFDSTVGLLYGNPAYDITDKVLKVLNTGK